MKLFDLGKYINLLEYCLSSIFARSVEEKEGEDMEGLEGRESKKEFWEENSNEQCDKREAID